MAPGVEFPRGVDLWVPLGIEQRVVERRGATFLQAIARAKPGFSHEQIESEVGALFQRLAADYPEAYSPAQQGVVTPLVQYWTGSARLHLWIMLGASVLLFLASTITSINLLLSRTTLRRSEIATRLALGAQFRHVLAQLAIEGVAIASTAAVAGLCMARLAIWFLVRWAPADIPRLSEAGLDLDSYCFAAGAAALAAVVCSTVPAFSAGRMKLETALREGGVRSSISHRAQSTRNMFILAQGAVTVALLVDVRPARFKLPLPDLNRSRVCQSRYSHDGSITEGPGSVWSSSFRQGVPASILFPSVRPIASNTRGNVRGSNPDAALGRSGGMGHRL